MDVILSKSEVSTKFDDVKLKVKAIADNCSAIEIIDQESLDTGLAIAVNANNLSKLIEEKRKAIKKPYKEAGETVDLVAKEITEDLNKAIVSAKEKIKVYNDAVKAAKDKEIKDLQELKRNIELQGEASIQLLKKTKDFILDKTDEMIGQLGEEDSATPERLDAFLKSFLPPKEFGIFADVVRMFRARITEAHDARVKMRAAPSLENKKAYAFKFNEMATFGNATFDSLEKEIKEETKGEAIATVQKMATTFSASTGVSERNTWTYEVTDISKIPNNYFTLDDKLVKEFMKANKETLKEDSIPGIRFYKAASIILK